MICYTLSAVWNLEVLYGCITEECSECAGACLAQTSRALRMSLTMGGGSNLATSNPAALKMDWSLRYGKPLMTPADLPHPTSGAYS